MQVSSRKMTIAVIVHGLQMETGQLLPNPSIAAVLPNLMVTHRTPEAATDQPFGHTCSVKPMSTWKLSFCCTIHLNVANGTKLATMTRLC